MLKNKPPSAPGLTKALCISVAFAVNLFVREPGRMDVKK
jgi:hypothetical protein